MVKYLLLSKEVKVAIFELIILSKDLELKALSSYLSRVYSLSTGPQENELIEECIRELINNKII